MAFWSEKSSSALFRTILPLFGGYIFSVALIHLLPEALESHGKHIPLFILMGFFIQMLLEKFSGGLEHGHIHKEHAHDGHDHGHDHSHYKTQGVTTALSLIISLGIHSILEGIPLNGPYSLSIPIFNNPLFVGIIMHKLPTAFALVTVLHLTSLNKSKIFLLLVVYMLMTPIGVLIGSFIPFEVDAHGHIANSSFGIITALVAGSFLHISTTILFESTENHKFNFLKVSLSFAGALLGLLM